VRNSLLGELADDQTQSCRAQVNGIVAVITKAANLAGAKERSVTVVERPIVSLEEAGKSTGIITKVGNRLLRHSAWL
jgi:hypothetical protein